jgi:hypothetical protein
LRPHWQQRLILGGDIHTGCRTTAALARLCARGEHLDAMATLGAFGHEPRVFRRHVAADADLEHLVSFAFWSS